MMETMEMEMEMRVVVVVNYFPENDFSPAGLGGFLGRRAVTWVSYRPIPGSGEFPSVSGRKTHPIHRLHTSHSLIKNKNQKSKSK